MSLSVIFNKSVLVGVVCLAAISASAYVIWGTRSSEPVPERVTGGEVKRVISGDYIKIEPDGRVKYAGINVPSAEDPLGAKTMELNRKLVDGKKIRMRFDETEKDKEGRWLAYVFVDGEMVNKRLVAEGLAYVSLKAGERRYAQELLAAQAEARDSGLGLWEKPVRSTEPRYPGDRKHGAFHRPACADVANTRPGNEVVFRNKQEAFDAGFAPCGHCQP